MVGITGVIALLSIGVFWHNHKIIRRMDLQREESSRPNLVFQLLPWRPGLVKLRIENVGAGPAIDVLGTITGENKHGKPASFEWDYPVLGPGKYEEFGLPPSQATGEERFRLERIRERLKAVGAEFTYTSGSKKKYVLSQTIEIEPLTSSWLESRMMATEDHPERLIPRIAEGIEAIAKNR